MTATATITAAPTRKRPIHGQGFVRFTMSGGGGCAACHAAWHAGDRDIGEREAGRYLLATKEQAEEDDD